MTQIAGHVNHAPRGWPKQRSIQFSMESLSTTSTLNGHLLCNGNSPLPSLSLCYRAVFCCFFPSSSSSSSGSPVHPNGFTPPSHASSTRQPRLLRQPHRTVGQVRSALFGLALLQHRFAAAKLAAPGRVELQQAVRRIEDAYQVRKRGGQAVSARELGRELELGSLRLVRKFLVLFVGLGHWHYCIPL